jgi:hypothetical protein
MNGFIIDTMLFIDSFSTRVCFTLGVASEFSSSIYYNYSSSSFFRPSPFSGRSSSSMARASIMKKVKRMSK